MARYAFKRLLAFIPTLLVVTILVALLMDLIPGDPVQNLVGQEATPELIVQRRQELGLDRPLMVRLVEYVTRAARGDLGTSFFLSKSVTETILSRYQVTLSFALLSLCISVTLGVTVGIVAAVYQGRPADWSVMGVTMLFISLPDFWLSLNLIFFFAVTMKWMPVGGFVPITQNVGQFFIHIILPALGLGLGGAAFIARYTRTSMLEVLRQDYITVAKAKGLRATVVLVRHALRNAFIPILTFIGLQFGGMLGGAAIIETVFAMPGIGRMIADSIVRRDYPVVQGGILVVTVSYLTVNLLVDLLYAWIDPRIRY